MPGRSGAPGLGVLAATRSLPCACIGNKVVTPGLLPAWSGGLCATSSLEQVVITYSFGNQFGASLAQMPERLDAHPNTPAYARSAQAQARSAATARRLPQAFFVIVGNCFSFSRLDCLCPTSGLKLFVTAGKATVCEKIQKSDASAPPRCHARPCGVKGVIWTESHGAYRKGDGAVAPGFRKMIGTL